MKQQDFTEVLENVMETTRIPFFLEATKVGRVGGADMHITYACQHWSVELSSGTNT